MEEKTKLYKYKSLKQFEYFMDILTQNRLYGSTFKELNDPMEGFFQSKNFTSEEWEKIKKAKDTVRICSLSKCHDNVLMWTHYADEHRGCCIELEVNTDKWERMDIEYSKTPMQFESGIEEKDALNQIARTKSDFWKYENEVRYVKTDLPQTNEGKPHKANLPIRVIKIYLGVRVDKQQQDRIKRIVKKINPDLIVEKMKRTDIKFWANDLRMNSTI